MLKRLIQIKTFLLALFVSVQCALADEIPNIAQGLPSDVQSNQLAQKIVNIALKVGELAGAVCVIMLVYAGYKFVTATTEKERAEAKELLKNIFIGLAIVSLAVMIVAFLANAIKTA
jgi:cytochrome bd-type quinol oxidase subunit 2